VTGRSRGGEWRVKREDDTAEYTEITERFRRQARSITSWETDALLFRKI
jgi:hypothetical protein